VTLAFVDSGAWLALVMPDDVHHQRAARFYRETRPRDRLVTTNYVLSETYTWLRYRSGHRDAVRFQRMIIAANQTRRLQLVWINEEAHERAWNVFERYSDQAFSFCDCTSFVVARDENVDFVFGFDNDFVTMGFELKPGAT
jgi:predicted nucleic acid-binding protein